MNHALRCRLAAVLSLLIPAGYAATPATGSSDSYLGMPAGFAEDGSPYLGSLEAPVVLEEWSDYACPFCARHSAQTVPALRDQYLRSGKVRLVFRDFPIAALHPTAETAHVAARCAGEQGAARYWAMHDALFERQREWSRLPQPEEFLAGVARGLGLDTASYDTCVQSGRFKPQLATSIEEGNKRGYNGTPTFLFRTTDGKYSVPIEGAQPVERFAAVADALVAGNAPPEEKAPERPPLPLWATPAGFAPDPGRRGYNQAGDAYKGSPQAKLVVIEFTDFQCPACRKHAMEVQPAVDAELVTPGKVLWVVKHLPLKMHAHALVAAAAAECAGEQDRFWPMHDRLFAGVERWNVAAPEAPLTAIATEAGLDPRKFSACLDSRRAVERVVADLYDAQDIVRATPSFVIIEGNAGSLTGSLPADQFVALLKERLSRLEAAASPSPEPQPRP